MARADRFITETQADVVRMLDLIEQAQGIAASRLQEYNSISDKSTMAAEYDWDAVDMDVADFVAGMAALGNIANILGANAAPLYKFKIEVG